MFIFFSSKDSLRRHPNNKAWEFTVELANPIKLEGQWECALMEIDYDKRVKKDLYIICDLCESSNVRDKSLSILRVVKAQNIFTIPYFVGVISHYITSVKVYILDDNLQTPSVACSTLRGTLQLREKF